MSISPVHGTSSDEKGQRFFCDFWEQWSSLAGGCNWYDFTLIKIGGEFAPYTERWELDLALLGVGMRLTYVYGTSFNEAMEDAKSQVIAELEGRTGCEVVDPTGALDRLAPRAADSREDT